MLDLWLISKCAGRTVRRRNKQNKVEEKNFERKIVNCNRSPKGSAHFWQIWRQSMHFLVGKRAWERGQYRKRERIFLGINWPKKSVSSFFNFCYLMTDKKRIGYLCQLFGKLSLDYWLYVSSLKSFVFVIVSSVYDLDIFKVKYVAMFPCVFC